MSTTWNFVFRCQKNEWKFGWNFRFFNLSAKTIWPFWSNFKNFVFRSQRTNDKLSHFAVKNEWPVKCNCRVLHLAVKKRMTVWVHAFHTLSSWLVSTCCLQIRDLSCLREKKRILVTCKNYINLWYKISLYVINYVTGTFIIYVMR